MRLGMILIKIMKNQGIVRVKKVNTYGQDFLTFVLENEPKTIFEALSTLEALFEKETINSEINSITQNNIWELVDLSLETKI